MPRPFTFSFDGRNSADMGIYARSYDFLMPPKREKRRQISFRHGSHDYGEAFYNDRTLNLHCFWLNDKAENLSRADIREIAFWLSRRGRLVLDNEPGKHYVGELFDPPELLARYDNRADDMRTTDGGFTLSFVCDPFAYGPQTIMPVSRGNNPVDYGGTADTPTLIVIRNPNSFPVSNIVLTATQRIRA